MARIPKAQALQQTPTPACDHKFIDSKFCLKCGWTPSDLPTEFLPEDLDVLALQVRKACDGLGFSVIFTATGSMIADPLLMVEWRSMHGIRHNPSRVRTHCYAHTFREAFTYILEYERRAKEYGEDATEKWHKDQQKAIERHAIPKGR